VQVFPALYDWVAYPLTELIRSLYENEMQVIKNNKDLPCPFRLELLAALERTLCFCHTGNTAVLATSLMNPLGLSRALVTDGFPMLQKVFLQPTISSAKRSGFKIDPRAWPLKDGYPAIASRRSQILTYSLEHFMVSLSFSGSWRIFSSVTCSKCAGHFTIRKWPADRIDSIRGGIHYSKMARG
jgi:hypothetical protein